MTRQATRKVFPLTRPQRNFVVLGSLLVGDAFSIALAFWLAHTLRFNILPYWTPIDRLYYLEIVSSAIPIWLALFWTHRLYSPKTLFGGLEEYARVFNAVTTGAVALVVLDFLLVREEGISRGWLVLVWVLGLILVGGFRFLMRRWVYFLRSHGHLLTQAVIVNADAEGLAMHENLKQWRQSGLKVVGFVDDRLPRGQVVTEDVRVLGGIDDLNELIEKLNIEDVIVATGSLRRPQLVDIYRSVASMPNIKLRFSSGLFEMISTGLHIKEMANVPLIEVNKVRITGMNAILKALVDYAGALLLLILLSPLYALLALLVRLDSPGPIFYKHRVLGLNGKLFGAFKFRTMYQNGDEIFESNPELKKQFEENFKLKDDPRVTRMGRFLRKTSLDELPQFVNVLLGQMSIVGPRFISPSEVEKYGKWGTNLMTVKPGITGLWQISGRSDVTYEERIRLDMYYIRNWTIWLDIYLLLATIPSVLSRKGAY